MLVVSSVKKLYTSALTHSSCYTGGIPQRLDTDVHGAVTAKTSTALWQRKRAQRCDSSGSDSVELTMCSDGNWQCCDSAVICHYFHNDVHIAVTLISNVNIAVTALSVDTAVTAQLPVPPLSH